MTGMAAHTHDHIDWAERIPALRRADELHAVTHAGIAARLVGRLGVQPVIVDAGSGAGGMSAAFAAELARRGGGTLVLVDAVPELLEVAEAAARAAIVRVNAERIARADLESPEAATRGEPPAAQQQVELEQARAELAGSAVAATVGRAHPGPEAVSNAAFAGQVSIESIRADVASVDLAQLVQPADLVWAASMVHHLPDQQAGVDGLVTALKSGGTLALAEGSPPTYCLPWDLGVGEPGLERRLLAARDHSFGEMRAGMPGSVRMPYGWYTALVKAGLGQVGSFSCLVDLPAPPSQVVRNYVIEHITWLASDGDELLTQEDRDVLRRLLDPADPEYLGSREDIYVLGTQTVHFGSRR